MAIEDNEPTYSFVSTKNNIINTTRIYSIEIKIHENISSILKRLLLPLMY
jgi:hypothetical protein